MGQGVVPTRSRASRAYAEGPRLGEPVCAVGPVEWAAGPGEARRFLRKRNRGLGRPRNADVESVSAPAKIREALEVPALGWEHALGRGWGTVDRGVRLVSEISMANVLAGRGLGGRWIANLG